jgi:hypothetical protein
MAALTEEIQLAGSPDRLYPVLSSPSHDFYAGRTADARQLLAGEWCPDVVVGLFDDVGNLVQVEYRSIGLKSEIEQRLREWYGYTPGLVHVKRFRIPPGPIQARFPPQWAAVGEPQFSVEPFSLSWKECYGDLANFPTVDSDFVEMIRGWIARGNFALYWGNEIHLDGRGEVVGT